MALISPLFCALGTAKSPFLLLKIPIFPGFSDDIFPYLLKINTLAIETKKAFLYLKSKPAPPSLSFAIASVRKGDI